MPQNTKKSAKLIFKRILEVSRDNKKPLILTCIMSAAAVLIADLGAPLIMAQILDMVQFGNKTLVDFLPILLAFAATQIVSMTLWQILIRLAWRNETLIQKRAFNNAFKKLLSHSVKFHSDHFGGSLVSQTNKFIGAIENFWDTIIFSVVQLAVSFIGAITILAFKFWPYAIVLTITIIAFIIATVLLSKNMSDNNILEAETSNKANGLLSDDMSNILAIKAFSAEKNELKLAERRAEARLQASLKVMHDVMRMMLTSSAINNTIRILAIVLAVLAQQNGLITVGTILLIVNYTSTVTYRLHEIRHIIRNYNRVIGDATEMVDILETPADVKDSSKKSLRITQGKIEFRNINFSHNAKNRLFKNFNLVIEPGQKVGLVGHSGSGKSSLTSLLMRFYDIDGGQILIDGTDIAKITQASLRQTIAYVPQEPMMFHRSVKENIAFGKPNAKLAEIKTAAVQACANEFIEKLPKKYQTIVGERGTKLSGGQRQRIAIARAVIKNAPILVLDEATSALDSESERLIQDALDELMVGRTSLVVAHRLSTIAKLDRIIVLDNGKIAEDGSHEELIAKNGIYARLWKRQSGGFLTEEEKTTK